MAEAVREPLRRFLEMKVTSQMTAPITRDIFGGCLTVAHLAGYPSTRPETDESDTSMAHTHSERQQCQQCQKCLELEFDADRWDRADAVRRSIANLQPELGRRPSDWDEEDIDSHRKAPPERDYPLDHC